MLGVHVVQPILANAMAADLIDLKKCAAWGALIGALIGALLMMPLLLADVGALSAFTAVIAGAAISGLAGAVSGAWEAAHWNENAAHD